MAQASRHGGWHTSTHHQLASPHYPQLGIRNPILVEPQELTGELLPFAITSLRVNGSLATAESTGVLDLRAVFRNWNDSLRPNDDVSRHHPSFIRAPGQKRMAGMSRLVLVTGAAGFVGSELVSQLVRKGHAVRALDNLATGKWENLGHSPLIERVQGDVRDAELLGRTMGGVGTVYHLACLNLRYSLEHPAETHEVNATGTLRVLEAARAAGVGRFVHVSSSEVYGTALTAPMAEDHPTYPTTPYGASKLAGEAYARCYGLSYGLPVAIVRPFNMYGPRCHWEGTSGEVIPRFLRRARMGLPLEIFGDGEQTRDFSFVGDTVRGIRLAAEIPEALGKTINLGSGREISMNALAGLVAPGSEVVHLAARAGDVRRLLCDNGVARRVLGYAPEISFAEELRRLEAVC